MTAPQARVAANVLLGAAAVAAAYVALTTPSLRRLVMRAGRYYLIARMPAYLLRETRRAWVAAREEDVDRVIPRRPA
jgi:hypothetical protein